MNGELWAWASVCASCLSAVTVRIKGQGFGAEGHCPTWLGGGYCKPRLRNRKSIATRNSCKHGHFLDFFLTVGITTLSKKNLAGIPVFIGLSALITIPTA